MAVTNYRSTLRKIQKGYIRELLETLKEKDPFCPLCVFVRASLHLRREEKTN
jgi:hypothetical protein